MIAAVADFLTKRLSSPLSLCAVTILLYLMCKNSQPDLVL
ncbi:hypothetical protein Y11_38901 [Yersinia enterocolitica subsp. palearctica Y11]|uniref:Uncharacterized protein n=2 Tax=Yersinia enterocolitica TaxID=630 RepID=A0A0H3NYD8_YERE1|nr:unknown protein [Yersinia enterocolitica W22703]CBY28640.1 hypothetical protein Y11_38901 [Yersinia enterocolitica subsp. palearctica Y11]CCO70520.1 hypothetical protein D322_3668 [Yersinia enterocolitica IP 10393]